MTPRLEIATRIYCAHMQGGMTCQDGSAMSPRELMDLSLEVARLMLEDDPKPERVVDWDKVDSAYTENPRNHRASLKSACAEYERQMRGGGE